MNNISFKIADIYDISNEDKNVILEFYRNLFIKMYKEDILDKYLKNSRKKVIDGYLTDDLNIFGNKLDKGLKEEFILIYQNDSLIGASRLRNFYEDYCLLVDVATSNLTSEEYREIYTKLVMFIENYLQKINIFKLYVAIPKFDPVILCKMSELDYVEDPDDISLEEDLVYMYNKCLERKKCEEFNSSSKQR